MGEIKKNIKGRIIDSFTNKPIKGVNIQLNDMSENKDVFTSSPTTVKTDVEGNFILNITYIFAFSLFFLFIFSSGIYSV
jgi:hypothetical protein